MEGTKISLAFACGESYEHMPVRGEGRYCGKCDQVVVDFTKMSLEEIRSWFEARKGQPVCGRYPTLHTNQPLKKKERHFLRFQDKLSRAKFWRPLRLSLLLLLTLAFLAAGCRSRKKIQHTHGNFVEFY